VANIDARTLLRLRQPVLERLAPGGVLILTGLLIEDEPLVAREYEAAGLTLCGRSTEDDWLLLVAARGSTTGAR
jgi:ribosomal protein L11 methyltransferase